MIFSNRVHINKESYLYHAKKPYQLFDSSKKHALTL
jgi:hypothetical protein